MSRPPTPPLIVESVSGHSDSEVQEPDTPPAKNVRWGTVETKERSTYAEVMCRSLGQGILRVYYSRWMAKAQFKRLELKNASLQRMLGDSSQLVNVKVKLLGEEVTKKAARIKELESKLATASILKKRKSSTMSAASLAQAAQLNEQTQRVGNLSDDLEGLRKELKHQSQVIKEKDKIIDHLRGSLEKANEAILSGADQYHESAVELHQARETLVHTAVSLSPKRDLTSFPSVGVPSVVALPSAAAITKHQSRSFPTRTPQNNDSISSRVVNGEILLNNNIITLEEQRHLESPTHQKSEATLSVEHHLADLIRRRGVSESNQQNKIEDRQFLETILHQIQLDRLHSSHVSGQPPGGDALQESIRRLLRQPLSQSQSQISSHHPFQSYNSQPIHSKKGTHQQVMY